MKKTNSKEQKKTVIKKILFSSAIYLFLFALLGMYSCSNNSNISMLEKNRVNDDYILIKPEPETRKLLRNPLIGWGIYSDNYPQTPDMEFWNKFDSIWVEGYDTPFKVSDYATHLYIRWPWGAFERAEGEYAWEFSDFFKLLEKGAIERGLKLAFRIYPDSRSFRLSCTPEYVREAGARGFMSGRRNSPDSVWTAYPDDPVFQNKYEKFLKVFAQRYNDPDRVEFIDGYGLGMWGEGHQVVYKDDANREKVFKWIVDLYTELFTKIPVAINYHRVIGGDYEWPDDTTIDPYSEELLKYAMEKGYILRHDAFGMNLRAYGSFEEAMVKKYWPGAPVIAENGYWSNMRILGINDGGRYDYKTWRDIYVQTLTDALNANANILDLRQILETRRYFEDCFDVVEKFIAEGGYRLYPDELKLPPEIENGKSARISHRWVNLGVGFCPTNLPQWKGRYNIAFALLDKQTLAPKYIFTDPVPELSDFLKGLPKLLISEFKIKKVVAGDYLWAVGIVNTTKDNAIGIQISAKEGITSEGWLQLSEVRVK